MRRNRENCHLDEAGKKKEKEKEGEKRENESMSKREREREEKSTVLEKVLGEIEKSSAANQLSSSCRHTHTSVEKDIAHTQGVK